jgi:hypothetical protein
MAKLETGRTARKAVRPKELGKSTLIGDLKVSIPMPRGATPPPPARADRGQARSGSSPDGRESKTND